MNDKITSIAKIEPAVITADFDSMKEKLDEKLATYKGFDVKQLASQQSGQLRRERADINSIINDVESARKAIKKVYNAPLAEFEAKCKELLKPARELSGHFKQAVDEKDRQARETRYNELLDYFNTLAGALNGVVDFEVFMKPEYLKKSYKLQKAKDEIKQKCERLVSDWKQLKSLNLQYQSEAEFVLFSTLDLGQALEAERRKREELKAVRSLENVVAENKGESQDTEEHVLVLECTEKELERVIGFCKENGIHGKIKGGK